MVVQLIDSFYMKVANLSGRFQSRSSFVGYKPDDIRRYRPFLDGPMSASDNMVMKTKFKKSLALAEEFAAIGSDIKLDSARQVLANEYQTELNAVRQKLDAKMDQSITKARARRDAGLTRAEKEIAKNIATPERLARAFRQALLHGSASPLAQTLPPSLPNYQGGAV